MKRFKILLPLCTLFLVLLNLSHSGCKDGTAETPIFPATYRYDAFEFKPSRFFVLTSATAHKEIPAAGNFLQYDVLQQEEFDFETVVSDGFPVQKMVLPDETKATISGTLEGPGTPPYSFDGTYTHSGNRLTLDFGVSKAYYSLSEDLSKAYWNTYSELYSFKKNGKTDYSPLNIERGFNSTNADSLVTTLRTKWKLEVNDTVALNFSRYRYVRQ